MFPLILLFLSHYLQNYDDIFSFIITFASTLLNLLIILKTVFCYLIVECNISHSFNVVIVF